MSTTIHIDGAELLAVLDQRGWTQGTYEDPDGGEVCAHGAIRLCAPQPGDAALIEQVALGQGWGPAWNDYPSRTEADVRDRLGRGVDITDDDLAATFGPQWRAVVALVRRAAALTDDEALRLVAAWDAGGDAGGDAARTAASWAAWGAARGAASRAASRAALDAARTAASWAARDAARVATGDAAWAVATWDLANPDGPYTPAMRDLLIAPWREACGLPDGLIEAA